MKSLYALTAVAVLGLAGSLYYAGHHTASEPKALNSINNPKFNEALPANKPPGGFAPVLFFYINGKFAKLEQFSEPEPNLVQCMEKAQIIVGKIMESDQRPPTGAVRGACIPIPGAPDLPAPAPREPDRANHDPTPPDLGGHPSTTI